MKTPTAEFEIDVRTDQRTTDVEAYVRCRLGGRLRMFRLTIVEKGVVLRGIVPTYHVKQLVQHAVMEVLPLPILANEIEVV